MRGLRIVSALAFAFLLVGCRTDAKVELNLHRDGSGEVNVTVTLDEQALEAAEVGGKKIEDTVVLDDLKDSGWKVGDWQRSSDGGASVTASIAFENPGDFAAVMKNLSGESGPLQDFRVSAKPGWLTSKNGVSGTIDFRKPQSGLADDEKTISALGAAYEDFEPDAVDDELSSQLENLKIRVIAKVPGKTKSVTVSAGEEKSLRVTSTTVEVGNVAQLVLALILLGAAASVVIASERVRRKKKVRESAASESSHHPSTGD